MFKAIQDVRMDGKTVLITGANVGLGKQSAIDLAERGARVILACRDPTRGQEAVDDVKTQSGSDNVVLQLVDLASLKSVREFAERINQTEERLDVLMNNAAVMNLPERTLTEDGFEIQLGVNHVGHFLLTGLLLDLIKRSAPSRIVNVSSAAHAMGKMKWEDLTYEKGGYGGWTAYSQSKLANVLFTKALNRRLQGTGVSTFSLHPGIVRTNLTRHTGSCLLCCLRMFQINVHKGAETQIYCSVCPDLEKESGNYFTKCKAVSAHRLANIEEDQEKLWKMSLEWTGLPLEE